MPKLQLPSSLGRRGRPPGAERAGKGAAPDGVAPLTPPHPDTAPLASALAEDVPTPSLPIQLNALQALCRQVFAFRLVMIAIGAPFALSRAQGPFGSWLVGAAVTVTFVGSYAMLRDWETFAPLLIKYRTLMAADLVFGSVLLLTASPDSALGYATACTPLLAGLLYGWRGAGIFAAVQILILATAYGAWASRLSGPAGTILICGFCVAAGVVGVTLRNLMFRFGEATQALSEVKARLAVTDAVGEERARLAREMHDSVAKTLHGVALAADSLAQSADRMDPLTVQHQAGVVARSARKAAAESREILSDLRRQADYEGGGVDLTSELTARVRDFAAHSGVQATLLPAEASTPAPPVPNAVARPLTTIASEAMENSHRHAHASQVTVELGVVDGMLRLSILDDGTGLPPGLSLEDLRKSGHFGLVGMVERAAGIGARIRIGRGHTKNGTEVRLELPTAALHPTPTPPCATGPPLPAASPPWSAEPPPLAMPPLPWAAGPPHPSLPPPAWAAGPPPGGGTGGQGGGPPAEPRNTLPPHPHPSLPPHPDPYPPAPPHL